MIRYMVMAMVWMIVVVPATAQPGQMRHSERELHGRFHGHDMLYRATVEEHGLPANAAKPFATLITTSYVLSEPRPSERRPVMFVFNGGPGASSSPLHFSAWGPVRLQRDASGAIHQEANPHCLLDQADLVFVDPPGTGFTRVFQDDSARRYWDVHGDAEMIVSTIREWVTSHGKTGDPIYICGESYGTMRAAAVMGMSDGLSLRGVIMLSAFLDMTGQADAPGNITPSLLSFPSMACIAAYHRRGAFSGKPAREVYEAAIKFCATEYAPVLFQGNEASLPVQKAMAGKLSRYLGLPDTFLLERKLKVTIPEFELFLLADKELRVGQLNGMVTGPLHAPAAKPPYDDPSFARFPSNRKEVADYFRQQLGFSDTSTYRTINFDVNAKWNWSWLDDTYGGYRTVAPIVAKALQDQPSLRIMVCGGYYDLATPVYASRFALGQAAAPREKITYAIFPTGHSIFEDEHALSQLEAMVREFLH
jgi:carboxypeptidase C (cathepsin A)